MYLNKAFPKDPHPLPNIDMLVGDTLEYKSINFSNVYSGYNQILMNLAYPPKLAFLINGPNYYYLSMS